MNARELEANAQLTEWVQADLNIDPGVALDLTTNDENGKPWDFDKP